MLDEIIYRLSFCATKLAFISGKVKLPEMKKNLLGFLFKKYIANFGAFCWNIAISLSAKLLFFKSSILQQYEALQV